MSCGKGLRVGPVIRRIRRLKNVTQEKLAEKAGVSINFLSQLENDKKGISSPALERVGEALRVPTSFFHLLADDSSEAIVAELQSAVLESLMKGAIHHGEEENRQEEDFYKEEESREEEGCSKEDSRQEEGCEEEEEVVATASAWF